MKALDHANTSQFILFPDEVRAASQSGGAYELKNTTGIVLAYIVHNAGAHVSPQVLARLVSTTASVIALADAHVPLLGLPECTRYVRRTSGGGVFSLNVHIKGSPS